MQELLGKLLNEKVLAIYKCGSRIYGLETNDSDADYTVIVESDFQPNVIKYNNNDYFLYGKKEFKEAISFSEGYLNFFLIWIDNTCLAKENLIYIDDEYKKEFFSLVDANWDSRFKKWLSKNLDYYGLRLKYSPTDKILYNLYRLNSIVKNYSKKGKFESVFFEEDKALSLDFKANMATRISHKAKLEEIFSFLKSKLQEGEKWAH